MNIGTAIAWKSEWLSMYVLFVEPEEAEIEWNRPRYGRTIFGKNEQKKEN